MVIVFGLVWFVYLFVHMCQGPLYTTDPKRLNKKEGPSEDASIPLTRGNKIITQGTKGEGHLGRRWVGEGKGEQDQV